MGAKWPFPSCQHSAFIRHLLCVPWAKQSDNAPTLPHPWGPIGLDFCSPYPLYIIIRKISAPSQSLTWWLNWQRICLQCRWPGFNPWVGKIPWRRTGYPLQYSGLENSMDCIVPGVTKSWTRLSDFHFTLKILMLNSKKPCIFQHVPISQDSI